jgi:glycosyltransferase involved in cell wall biosynthesis
MSSLISEIKLRIKDSTLYRMASAAKGAYVERQNGMDRVIRLGPQGKPIGRALISYYIEPYLLDASKSIPPDHPYYWHPNYWECTEIARSLVELGYGVDIIGWRNSRFLPQEEYSVFFDCRHNMERLAPLLPKSCMKIFHIDVAHILFQNAAESQRLLAVQQRRGATLQPRRFEHPNLGIEYADCATMLGNRFTADTFAYAGKPTYSVPISTPVIYPWPEGKNFHACRRNFMWLGSGGLVRKGLDLVLEAFADMPDFHLTVCGPVSNEKDFEQAYRRELYELPNIHTVGWVDLGSQKFLDLMRDSVALIYPSCCEGQCGGVITALASSLIPVISYESGVDVHDFGTILRTSSISEIRGAVEELSGRPCSQLENMARKAWEYAQDHHSRAAFAREWRRVLYAILAERGATQPEHFAAVGCDSPSPVSSE